MYVIPAALQNGTAPLDAIISYLVKQKSKQQRKTLMNETCGKSIDIPILMFQIYH